MSFNLAKAEMEFFFDVDGVVLDFESSFVDLVRDEYLPDLPVGFAPSTWTMTDEFKGVDLEEAWLRFVESDRMSSLGPLVDSEVFNTISSRFPTHFVTNIPRKYFSKREENLNAVGFKYSGLHLAGHFNFGDAAYPSKSALIADIRSPGKETVFLDDHPKNCRDVKTAHPEARVFLMTRPHNRSSEEGDWTRVDDWNSFLTELNLSGEQ